MTNSDMEDALEEAISKFDESPPHEEIENGLNTEDSMKLQLRKSCRLLDASEKLLEKDESHYIIIIDACFISIERSIQAYLLEKKLIDEGEPLFDHEKIYRLGRQAGLFDEDFEQRIKNLWKDNRSKTYYRDGLPSKGRAEKMFRLAEAVHNHIVGMSNSGHKCICK
ncbi:hypothetical protein [Candidatus Nanohalobium constans]|uniref:DUF8154 domain-containing protein n=1 Tax=Candidatus Nanohalobium constans TaxID=2565781 RepID=A0A5Q0UFW4_9ARCH|nr:hypothetical protein [Candidatus Nanohalobium constans]QGA80522.1 hypothetical protein LC1Nh_0629 [Candidatus Nanohalobium constans]